jgi:putative ABC transport system permease protein
MDTLLQDVRYGFRSLCRNPGFALVVVWTLALGIGANTAIFSVVNAALLRQLPFRDPDRLVVVWDQYPQAFGTERIPVALPNLLDWKSSNHVFEEMGAFTAQNAIVVAAGEPERIATGSVSDSFFSTLGVTPLLGRNFLSAECLPSGAPVAIVSYGYWQQHWGRRIDAIGQSVSINRKLFTVVGVLPPDFQLAYKFMDVDTTPEIWVPFSPNHLKDANRGNHIYVAVARLKPEVSLQQAQVEMNVITDRMEKQYEDCRGFRSLVLSLHESLTGHLRPTLLPLLAAVGFVLLIACANVANLLLARAASREKELAIRSALGAGRMRIVRQFLTESLLLALMGGAVGLLVAFWGCNLINGFLVETGLDMPSSSIGGRVLTFTFLVSLLTGVVFGLVPALESSRVNLNQSLKEAGRTASLGSTHRWLKSLLVISEVALSLVLLVGAGLLIKSFAQLWLTNPGFSKEKVLTMTVPQYSDGSQIIPTMRIELCRQLLERVGFLPGVQSVAFASNLPTAGGWTWAFHIEGRPTPGPGKEPNETVQFVSPSYFRTLGIPLKRGRVFTEQDTEKGLPVAVINEAMALKYWGDQNSLGEHITPSKKPYTIVGVVGDVRQDGLATEPKPGFYLCSYQEPLGETHLVVRTATEPLSLAAAVRQQVRALDSTLAVADIRTLEMVLSRNVSRQRLVMSLMGVFAFLALLLAMIGIYGVVAYFVSQRQPEIGIRMALGAKAGDILKMVLRQGMALTLVGLALGGIGALALTRWLTSELSGVSPTDPLVFSGVVALMILVSLLACILPARRAARVDPLVALRYE